MSGIDRQSTDRQLRTGINMMLHKLTVIHSVELITRKDQVIFNIPFLKEPLIFAHGICRALKPAWAVGGLLSSEDLNKALAETS